MASLDDLKKRKAIILESIINKSLNEKYNTDDIMSSVNRLRNVIEEINNFESEFNPLDMSEELIIKDLDFKIYYPFFNISVRHSNKDYFTTTFYLGNIYSISCIGDNPDYYDSGKCFIINGTHSVHGTFLSSLEKAHKIIFAAWKHYMEFSNHSKK